MVVACRGAREQLCDEEEGRAINQTVRRKSSRCEGGVREKGTIFQQRPSVFFLLVCQQNFTVTSESPSPYSILLSNKDILTRGKQSWLDQLVLLQGNNFPFKNSQNAGQSSSSLEDITDSKALNPNDKPTLHVFSN